jgi:adenylate kinase family enzyme
VIGGAGTGKTTLARRIGGLLRLPVHEMDLDFDLGTVLGQRDWVTEGIYLWNVHGLLEAADVVVWLDLPYRTCLRRILVRHFIASARRQNRYRGLRRLWSFASGSRWYWKVSQGRPPTGPTDWGALSRAQTVEVLRPFSAKVVRLRSGREVDAWLLELADGCKAKLPPA